VIGDGAKRLIWHAGLYSATAGVYRLVGFVLFLWLARTLSVAEFANFGLLYATQSGVTTLALAGVAEAVVASLRDCRTPDSRAALYATAVRIFAAGAFVVGVPAIGFLAAFISGGAIPPTTAAYAVGSGVLLGYAALQAQLIRLEEQHRASLFFSFAAPLAGLVGGFLAVLVRPQVSAFFLGSMLGVLGALLVLAPKLLGFRHPRSSTVSARAQFMVGVPFILVAFFGWISGYGSNYIINIAFDPAEVARFTFLLTLTSVLQLIATALNQVWSPRFYQLIHEQPILEVERKNSRFFRVQALVLGLAAGCMVALYPMSVRLLGGTLLAYQSMTLELALMLAYYIIATPVWHAQNYFLAFGRGRDLMFVTLTSGVIGIGALLLLMKTLGPIGLYLGFVAQVVARAAGYLFAARSHWKLAIAWDGILGGLLLTGAGYLVTRI
jgi:O-antigen/teichoic acid export membrane protein